jgi:hypothetical protein
VLPVLPQYILKKLICCFLKIFSGLELAKLLMATKIDVITAITHLQTQTAFDTMIANKTI